MIYLETLFINDIPLEFNRIIYVDINSGDNILGDGSDNSPYKTVDKALQESANNDCIFIRSGVYRLNPIIIDVGYQDGGIYDFNKSITIAGEGSKTILEFYGSDGVKRDNVLICLENSNSVITNLTMRYYPPNKSAEYSRALFLRCNGKIKNIYFENPSSVAWSYNYYNGAPANTPVIENCIFKSNKNSVFDYSGSPLYKNCLFDKLPTAGTKSYCIVRSITESDLLQPTESSDLYRSGDPTILNPDGSRSHIGIFGGLFAWVTYLFSNVVSVITPPFGYINEWDELDEQYVLKLVEGLAFDSVDVDYDFYTTADNIKIKPLNLGTVVGGGFSQTFAFEVINTHENKDFQVILRAIKNNILADESDSFGLLPDALRPSDKTRVSFSLTDEFVPEYPLIFNLSSGQKQVVYLRILASTVTSGDAIFQITLVGREI